MLDTTILHHFTGTEQWTRYQGLLLTDGAKYVADNGATCKPEMGGAWWLIDLIRSYQSNAKVRREPFQVFRLIKDEAQDGAATVYIEDGNSNVLAQQRIPRTDFDFANTGNEFALWYVDNVVLLPSEY